MSTPPPAPRPPLVTDLTWDGGLRFEVRCQDTVFHLDGDSRAAPSPVQALAASLAGCMSIDVVHILTKGRLDLLGLEAHFEGVRAPDDPKRLTAVDLHFVLQGSIPPDRVERAIALSREKYCSVWHSLRPDIEFTTSFEVREPTR